MQGFKPLWTVPREKKARRFSKEQIILTLELELLAVLEQAVAWHGVRGVLSGRWLADFAPLAVMNKQPTLEQDRKKRRSRPKLQDLPSNKDLTGGSSAKSVAPENGSSGIPLSLQEFLKRDSLPIKSH